MHWVPPIKGWVLGLSERIFSRNLGCLRKNTKVLLEIRSTERSPELLGIQSEHEYMHKMSATLVAFKNSGVLAG